MNPKPTENPWFVAVIHPWAERQAYKKLTKAGFVAYSPVQEVRRVVRGAERLSEVPYFPGYVFVERDERWRAIGGIGGGSVVIGLLPLGRPEAPIGLAPAVIERVRAIVAEDGASRRSLAEWFLELKKGDLVEITSGPLIEESIFRAKRIGRFLGRKRGALLLEVEGLFGREATHEVPIHQTAPAPEEIK